MKNKEDSELSEEFEECSSLTVECLWTQLFFLLSNDSRLIYLLFK